MPNIAPDQINRYKAFFLSHGGGPLPLLGDPGHEEMVSCLKDVAAIIPKPNAVVVVSAHWEGTLPTITSGASPSLIYDYYGFPEEAYAIRYPCVGEPSIARNIYKLLRDKGIQAELDEGRGFDHGLFIPLNIMYPQADIPCVQLSLVRMLDPAKHIEIGRAISPLIADNILIIGSGFSFHNMREFFRPNTPESQAMNHSFEEWLHKTCSYPGYSENERTQLLLRWADAPGAVFCHPRAEHLLPLHVCYGVAQSPSTDYFDLHIMGKKSSMYLW